MKDELTEAANRIAPLTRKPQYQPTDFGRQCAEHIRKLLNLPPKTREPGSDDE